MGDVIGDINSRRGSIVELTDRNGLKQVESTVPLANMFQVRALRRRERRMLLPSVDRSVRRPPVARVVPLECCGSFVEFLFFAWWGGVGWGGAGWGGAGWGGVGLAGVASQLCSSVAVRALFYLLTQGCVRFQVRARAGCVFVRLISPSWSSPGMLPRFFAAFTDSPAPPACTTIRRLHPRL